MVGQPGYFQLYTIINNKEMNILAQKTLYLFEFLRYISRDGIRIGQRKGTFKCFLDAVISFPGR